MGPGSKTAWNGGSQSALITIIISALITIFCIPRSLLLFISALDGIFHWARLFFLAEEI